MRIEVKEIYDGFAEELKNQISNAKPDEPITLHIDSPGGYLDQAYLAYNYLRSLDRQVDCIVENNCMSAAVLVCLGCKNRQAYPTAHFLVHSPIGKSFGDVNLSKAESMYKDLKFDYENLVRTYKDRGCKKFEDFMQNEEVFSADEALKMGFITGIKEYGKVNKFKSNKMNQFKKFLNAFSEALKKMSNEAFVTSEGTEFEAEALEVGSSVNLPDGSYEVNGKIITVEAGVIVDVTVKVEEPEAPAEEAPVVENAEEEEKKEEEEEKPAEEEKKEEEEEKNEEVSAESETAPAEEAAPSLEEKMAVLEERIAALEAALASKEEELEEVNKVVNKVGGIEKLQNVAKLKEVAKEEKKVNLENAKEAEAFDWRKLARMK